MSWWIQEQNGGKFLVLLAPGVVRNSISSRRSSASRRLRSASRRDRSDSRLVSRTAGTDAVGDEMGAVKLVDC